MEYSLEKTQMQILKMVDEFDKHGCAFLNEANCEEELEESGLEYWDVEISHFEEDMYGE